MELKELDYKDRVINIIGNIDEASVQTAISKIVEINIKDSEYVHCTTNVIGSCGFKIETKQVQLPPIIINLSTYGGEVYSGWGLADAIRHSNTPVKIICYGKIMSMGIPILLSAKYKAAHQHTTFMIHGTGGFEYGKTEHMRESMEENNRLEQQLANYIVTNSKFPKKKMNEIIKQQKDYYFNTEEALQYKIIDEII